MPSIFHLRSYHKLGSTPLKVTKAILFCQLNMYNFHHSTAVEHIHTVLFCFFVFLWGFFGGLVRLVHNTLCTFWIVSIVEFSKKRK